MKNILLLPTLALSAGLAGCVGVGPNTQQGAVAGGALGAIAGAVIGHNSAGADALGGAILGGTAGAIAGGALGNSVDNERGTLYDSQPAYVARERMIIRRPVPPAPPAPSAVWIPGYWSFDGRAHAWIAGHWEIPPRPAQNYIAGHWESTPGGTVFVPGTRRFGQRSDPPAAASRGRCPSPYDMLKAAATAAMLSLDPLEATGRVGPEYGSEDRTHHVEESSAVFAPEWRRTRTASAPS